MICYMGKQYMGAKEALKVVLNREWNLRGSAPNELLEELTRRRLESGSGIDDLANLVRGQLFIRKNASEIIAVGTNQIVLTLCPEYIAKAKKFEFKLPHHYAFTADGCFDYNPEKDIFLRTEEVLEELGFRVVKHHYVGVENKDGNFEINDNGGVFAIASDLRECGKYEVKEAEDENLKGLHNGSNLKKKLVESVSSFQKMSDREHPLYCAEVSSHVIDVGGSQEEAFRRIFLLRINRDTNIGELVAGDLDHVYFWRAKTSS